MVTEREVVLLDQKFTFVAIKEAKQENWPPT